MSILVVLGLEDLCEMVNVLHEKRRKLRLGEVLDATGVCLKPLCRTFVRLHD